MIYSGQAAAATLKLSDRLSLELITDSVARRINKVPVPDITSLYPYDRLQAANGIPARKHDVLYYE